MLPKDSTHASNNVRILRFDIHEDHLTNLKSIVTAVSDNHTKLCVSKEVGRAFNGRREKESLTVENLVTDQKRLKSALNTFKLSKEEAALLKETLKT